MTVLKDAYIHKMKQGDTEPSVWRQLVSKKDGTPIPMFSATARFIMRDANGNVKVNAAAVIVDAATGVLRYDWIAADVNQAGTFEAEFQITFSGGGIHTIPNDGYIVVEFEPQLGS